MYTSISEEQAVGHDFPFGVASFEKNIGIVLLCEGLTCLQVVKWSGEGVYQQLLGFGNVGRDEVAERKEVFFDVLDAIGRHQAMTAGGNHDGVIHNGGVHSVFLPPIM